MLYHKSTFEGVVRLVVRTLQGTKSLGSFNCSLFFFWWNERIFVWTYKEGHVVDGLMYLRNIFTFGSPFHSRIIYVLLTIMSPFAPRMLYSNDTHDGMEGTILFVLFFWCRTRKWCHHLQGRDIFDRFLEQKRRSSLWIECKETFQLYRKPSCRIAIDPTQRLRNVHWKESYCLICLEQGMGSFQRRPRL